MTKMEPVAERDEAAGFWRFGRVWITESWCFFLRTRTPVENIKPEGSGLSDLPSRSIMRTESNVELFLNTEMRDRGKG